ncbi:hypothetical protein H257_16965 [Aphanomyces astaci]|uniref:Chromo domain-containing protein n=1 Tax=Aphanomyces astaci TaxID=112090 RepID=W4FIW0_APHAT|nr:hypothetical protein H257_16965 [Aphanomyces astaci]ETV66663.1 hypothetical protein H257_16965 [Aphanomyces astaci]|eukprot:XP_009843891.1 hypothetical protein H257_16965 [Aphanomyces astaci]
MKLNADEWPHVLPLVQGALNHQSADRLGGIAPVTAFTGLSAMTLRAATRCPRKFTSRTGLVPPVRNMSRTSKWRLKKCTATWWCKATSCVSKRVDAAIENPKSSLRVSRSAILCFRSGRQPSDKIGPALARTLPSDQSHHRPCDGDSAAGAITSRQIAFGDGGFHVERLDEVRCVDGQHQVLVKWLGLDDEESSWEPAANLLDDIPVVFRKWAVANKEDPTVAALIKTLGFP